MCLGNIADGDWCVEAVAYAGENVRISTQRFNESIEVLTRELEFAMVDYYRNDLWSDLWKYL